MVAHVYFERNVGVKGDTFLANEMRNKRSYFNYSIYFVEGHVKLSPKAIKANSNWGGEGNALIFTS